MTEAAIDFANDVLWLNVPGQLAVPFARYDNTVLAYSRPSCDKATSCEDGSYPRINSLETRQDMTGMWVP